MSTKPQRGIRRLRGPARTAGEMVPPPWGICWSALAIVLMLGVLTLRGWSDEPTATDGPPPTKRLFRGRVVSVTQALEKRGLKASTAELRGQVALDTPSGELLLILPDWRGKAFYQDERLRDRPVELVGYRRTGLPYLQILQVYTADALGRWQYTDYWCDICSIPMYEIKPCDCCQQEIRLRFQPQDPPPDVELDGSARVLPAADRPSR
mgnify:CR=1 FL=1|uniref:Uncharacterized protein n=1 Tax=Schlesneria paludicola TaxID=360056 RepID=A0A7C4QT08_9PLAN